MKVGWAVVDGKAGRWRGKGERRIRDVMGGEDGWVTA